MSKSVDQRVVDMRFDNKQFEQGIATSIKSLDKLKTGLNMDGASKSLSNLEKTSKSFSLAGLATNVENVSSKFTALGVMGVTALANITNSAVNAGVSLVKSLTVDPIKAGLDEYETKIGAIQTILTNTASKGTTLDDVTNTLNTLNTYADQTIYNFAEMTRNIGTFTAAGIGLEESATAIKGIANLAAGSGSTAQQASTAMYQLSQALAAGSLKLQDWNSVVNAGMGGEMFQNALKASAKEMGIFVDESKPFRETLEQGWVTTEVLTKTLSRFAEDAMLTKAATEVKTFTQMLDTMKESVQSGWSMSWEYILGDKEESAALFTAINNGFGELAGSSADARNEMLKFWNDNGGRDAIITALSNAFNTLSDILSPIKEAFRELFPQTTGQQLTDISNKIKDLSEKFKIGDETADNIKRTFKGLFAVLDIGRQALVAVASGFVTLLSSILPAGEGLLGFTANIGDWLVGLNDSIRTSGIFTKGIETISEIVTVVAGNISKGISAIGTAFASFTGIDLGGLDTFSSNLKIRFEPFTTLGKVVSKAFEVMGEGLKKVAPIFLSLGSLIATAFSKLSEGITNALNNADFNQMFDILNGGLFAAILLGIKKFMESLTDITDGAGGMLDGVTGILDGVKGSLEAYQSQLQAGTLIKIASAIGILAASLVAISLIDSTKLTGALTAMGVMMAELFASMAIFEKVMAGSGFTSMGKLTISMIALSTAILILSSALTKIATLDWNGLIIGLTGVASLSAILVVSAKSLSASSNGLTKGSIGLVIFAAAINVLAEAVIKLSDLDVSGLTKGLVGVGVLMTELALFMKATDLNKMGILKATGIVILSSALLIMASAVEKIALIDVVGLTKGLTAMGIIFTQLGLFMTLTGGATNVTSTAIGLTILGAAMNIFASAVIKLGEMSINEIVKGLAAMAGVLVAVAAGMAIMPKNMIAQGAAMVIIATSLNILASALNSMSDNTWEGIAKGLVTLAGSLAIIAVAMTAMTTALPGAAALMVVSAALLSLTPALTILGNMSLGEIGTSLLALVGVFGVLGGAAVLLAPLTPALLGLTGSIALLGIGCGAVGAGLAAFSAGLAALAVSGTAGAAALVVVITSIIGLIPAACTALGKGLVDFIKVVGDGAQAIGKAVTQIVSAVLDTIIDLTPKLMEGLVVLLDALLKVILEFVPKIVEGGIELIMGLLEGIAKNIQKVVETAIDVVLNFIKGVTSKIPDIIQSGVDVILSFVNGMADAIRKNTPLMITAFQNLFDAIVDAAIAVLFGSIQLFMDQGTNIITGVITGVSNSLSKFVDCVNKLVTAGVNALFKGVKDFTNAGKDMVSGFIDGMTSMISSAAKSAANMAKKALDAAKDVLGIHSPSREFKAIGRFVDQGLIDGIDGSADKVAKSSAGLGNTAMDSIKRALVGVNDLVNADIDTNPTIRPILDLSDVNSGVSCMNKMFKNNKGLDLSASISDGVARRGTNNPDWSILKNLIPKPNDHSKPQPQNGGMVFNIYSNDGDPMTISRQIQKDLTSYNRALGIV